MPAGRPSRPAPEPGRAVERRDLTEQQRQCLRLVGFGYDSRRVAESLGISPRRASMVATALKHRLGASTREELATEAARIFGWSSAG